MRECDYHGCTFPATVRIMFTSGMNGYYCNNHSSIFEQDIIVETEPLADNAITQAVTAFFEALKNNQCPVCNAPVEREKQIGGCVYAEPCGHRMFQGRARK